MEQQFSLTWEFHKRNMCNGLSSLQQNGEFVDMTLAADGHHVKVHQMIMALASPYIKELLASIECKHPVIFLNKMSYTTLCSILEYVYTGETLVTKDKLNDLVEAAKELHIQGLQDVKYELTLKQVAPLGLLAKHRRATGQTEDDTPLKKRLRKERLSNADKSDDSQIVDVSQIESDHDDVADTNQDSSESVKGLSVDLPMQYTISNQGSIQMILNRYIYFLQYTSRMDTGHRNWLCVDNRNSKCNASVITKGDVIVKRIRAHTHSFHDKKILKKVRDNAVYATINDAEAIGNSKKQRHSEESAKANDKNNKKQ